MENILSQPSKSTAFAAILLAVLLIVPIVSGGGGTVSVTQTGTASNTFALGNDVSNTVGVTFPTPYASPPTLICCPFSTSFTGLQPLAISWSTVFVPPQIRNATNPTFDVSARHDQNNSTCSPCTNKVTITPSGLDEVVLVHIFYISDVTISVSSVTATGLHFTPIQPFGTSNAESDEIWSATAYQTTPIAITVTFSAPGSTIVTTSVVATAFANAVTVSIASTATSGTGTTSPITVTDQTSEFSMVIGNVFLTNAGVACSDPTPGSGQTQVLNANTFCATNTNGGVGFLYNYDIEYFNIGTQASYNYNTNFNGTVATGLSINVQLMGGQHHDRVWTIVGTTNSTLYNTEQYNTPLNPPFQAQVAVATRAGVFQFVCNYANENVSTVINIEFGSVTGGPFTVATNINAGGFSGTICDGNLHSFTIPPGFGIDDNILGRIRAYCTSCPNALQISITNMVIGWRLLGQVQVRETIISLTATGFQVRWLASYPAGVYGINWQWTAIGTT